MIININALKIFGSWVSAGFALGVGYSVGKSIFERKDKTKDELIRVQGCMLEINKILNKIENEKRA
jgi:hypothetical protein